MAQCLAVVQKNQFVAMAAGVVVHQHTRVLMADLHSRGGGVVAWAQRACGGAGLQQLASKLAGACKATAVGPTEIKRVVVEVSSGPQAGGRQQSTGGWLGPHLSSIEKNLVT